MHVENHFFASSLKYRNIFNDLIGFVWFDCRSGKREGGAWDQQRVDQRRRRRQRRRSVRHDELRGVVERFHDGIRADGVPDDAFQVFYVNTRGIAVKWQRVVRNDARIEGRFYVIYRATLNRDEMDSRFDETVSDARNTYLDDAVMQIIFNKYYRIISDNHLTILLDGRSRIQSREKIQRKRLWNSCNSYCCVNSMLKVCTSGVFTA